MQDVALVLSSGGPRGFAYIGAIEELERRGYNISSISGCSMGSLIGGVYAAGKMQEFKEWAMALDNFRIMQLLDPEISISYMVRGRKIIQAIEKIVPNMNIEDLRIPYAAVATDLGSGEPVVFRSGRLFDAIRASISIPSMFKPVEVNGKVLIDGGVVDTMPYDIVERQQGDILIGFDVNDRPLDKMDQIKGRRDYYTILSRTFSLMNHAIARVQSECYRPDILVTMPFDRFRGLSSYGNCSGISEEGRRLMAVALDDFEK